MTPSTSPKAYADMARILLPGAKDAARRVALLVKNLKVSGGNRVILALYDQLQRTDQVEVHVRVVPEARPHVRELWNLIACKRRYGAAASVTRIVRPLDPGAFDVLVSTSRRTLDFVADLSHPAHVHLLQAVEAWDTENAPPFLDYCRTRHYPGPEECIELVHRIGLPQDVRYVRQLSEVRRVLAVSDYVGGAIRHAGRPDSVTVCAPPLPLAGTGGHTERTLDVLLFLRGFAYTGDDMVVAIANALADKPYRVVVVAGNYSTRRQLRGLHQRERLSVVRDPPAAALASLYAASRVVVHPTLCSGGGFIPFEARSFGCAVVASRTGWLMSGESGDRLAIVQSHDLQTYLRAIVRLLEGPSATRAHPAR